MKSSFKFLASFLVTVSFFAGCGAVDKIKEKAKDKVKADAIKEKMDTKLKPHCSGTYSYVGKTDNIYTFKCDFNENQTQENTDLWTKECGNDNTQILETTLICNRKVN